jgi:diguanylate cyclase (GGDEF)-like protein
MEEIISKISKKTLDELKKAGKQPYPLYYKNTFNLIAKEDGIYESLNPKLLLDKPDINESLVDQTSKTIKQVTEFSEEIKQDSQNLIEEVKPDHIGDIREIVVNFTKDLVNKINLLEETVKSLEKELDKAYKELLIDPLTKVYNRKALINDLEEILKRGKDKDLDLVIAVIDLDKFKEINDTFGHLVGDFVLIKVIEIIRKYIRSEHKIYRYGGDEFVVIFNRVSIENIEKIIERILNKIEHTILKYKENLIKITVSIGITAHRRGDTFESIINRADEALYQAKETRNKYVKV